MGKIYQITVTFFLLILVSYAKYEQLTALELALYSRITYRITDVKKW
jgi:hypothetical protein